MKHHLVGRDANAWWRQAWKIQRRKMGREILIRASVMACAIGMTGLTLTRAGAQAPLNQNEATEKFRDVSDDTEELLDAAYNSLDKQKCLNKVTINSFIMRAKYLETELIKVKYEPALPKNLILPKTTTTDSIDLDIGKLESLIKLLPTKLCPSETTKAAIPPPPDKPAIPRLPITPPKVTLDPTTPPVAETPKEGPIAPKAYLCLTAEAKGELDQLRREILNIEVNLLNLEDDEKTVSNTIKSGNTGDVDPFIYSRYFGFDMLPGNDISHSPQELSEEIARLIKANNNRLEELRKRRDALLYLPRCPPDPATASAPPPSAPVTPPVAETPKPVAKTCPACRTIADQIADVDEQIASWERQDVTIRKESNVNDPGIQNALKDIANKIAQLKSRKAQLEERKPGCENKCTSTTEDEKASGKTNQGQPTPREEKATGEKPPRGTSTNKKTTDQKRGRKHAKRTPNDKSGAAQSGNGMSPETARAIGTIIDVGIGVGLSRVGRHHGGDRSDEPERRTPRSVPRD